MDIGKKICEQFISRAAAQHMKGKARDRAAIEFVCGAVAGIAATHPEGCAEISQATMTAFLVATRGYDEVARIAQVK